MRLVIELKRDAIPKVVLNKLYKHTPMQTTFGVNMVALVDNVPRTLALRAVIHNYVAAPARGHRPPHQARAAPTPRRRAHILEGLLIALDNLDAVIELIRGSRDRDAARERPDRALRADASIQAQAILDLRLQQLTALEADAIKQRARRQGRAHRASCASSSATRTRVLGADQGGARRDLRALRRRAAHARSPTSEDDIDIEDLIADQQMVITITQLRLHQVAAAGHLPPAAPRRRRA